MKPYKRDQEDKINSINRCFFDAERGWIQLALDRLADLRREFPDDGQVEYAEALLRKDFLGQGNLAEEFFLKALRADPTHKFAAFNAGKYARSWEEFQRQAGVARKVCAGDPDLRFFQQVEENAQDLEYTHILVQAAQEYHSHEQFGESAAFAELSLAAGRHSLENESELRKGRAVALRQLDKAAAESRDTRGEGFPPEERLALKAAVAELEKAIALDPDDHMLWNFQSAWMILLCRWDDAIEAADKALSLAPEGYVKPLTNKAFALAAKGLKDAARAEYRRALEMAKSLGSEGRADREISERSLEDLSKRVMTDDELLTALAERITTGANLIARQEMAQWKGSQEGEELLKSLKKRCAAAGSRWSDLYLRIVGEMLIYFCPASAWKSILQLSESNTTAYEHCLYAVVSIAAHEQDIVARDACRLLVYHILGAREPERIRKAYREAILGPAAADPRGFGSLAERMRAELMSTYPNIVKLMADQAPLTIDEIEHARQVTLARFGVSGHDSPRTSGGDGRGWFHRWFSRDKS
jgi:tetratricopeptide (TPR) repeat protein